MAGKLGDLKKVIADEHIILREDKTKTKASSKANAKPGVKSLMDDSKSYKKIHPDANEATRKKIKKLCAELDLPLWLVIEQAVDDLAKKHKIN